MNIKKKADGIEMSMSGNGINITEFVSDKECELLLAIILSQLIKEDGKSIVLQNSKGESLFMCMSMKPGAENVKGV